MEYKKKLYRQDVILSPLRILRQQTKQIIATYLDSRKILLTETKLHRDWRGLAEKAGLDLSVIRSSKISFTEHCFNLWIQKGASIKELLEALEIIDRFDIIDDNLQLIYDDYDYAMSKDVLRLKPIPPPLDEIESSISLFDSNVLTTDDQKNLSDGGTLQFYDALVLFADEDLDFVDEMVQKLEGEYNLKLCLKDRDLVGGLAFELNGVMRLIEERCARVIVVLSPAFLKSKANTFFTQFAHALGVDRQRRIVIPCMYQVCKKPPELSFCHSLDYFRTKGYWDYWKKLADSLISPSNYRFPAGPNDINQGIRPITSPTIVSSDFTLPALPDVPISCPSPDFETRSSTGILSKLKKSSGRKDTSISQGLQHASSHRSDVSSDNYSYRSSPTNTTVSTAPLLPSPTLPHKEHHGIWKWLKNGKPLKKFRGPKKKRIQEPVSA